MATQIELLDPNGKTHPIGCDVNGNLLVSAPEGGFSYQHEAAAGTYLSKTGAGVLHAVHVNTKGVTDTVTVYDGIDDTGTVIAALDATVVADHVYDAVFTVGLCVVIAGGTAADATWTWK